jgi:hypothetical protein
LGIRELIPQRPKEHPSHFATGWHRTGWAVCISYVVFYTLLANIPFWAASRWLAISPNGWFCLEYIAVGLLALFIPRALGSAVLLLAIVLDLLAGVCETYLIPLSQCFQNLNAIGRFSGPRLLAGGAVALLAVIIAIASSLLATTTPKKYRVRAAVCLLAFGTVLLSMDCVTVVRRIQSLPAPLRPGLSLRSVVQSVYITEPRVSRSPTLLFMHRKLFAVSTGLSIRSASALALDFAGSSVAKNGRDTPNLVVILVESWGLGGDASIRNSLVQPYALPNLLARYTVLQGTVPFYGSTVAGEARELCGNTLGFQLMEAPAAELQNCLPKRLTGLDYHAVALHGMDGKFFRRSTWYKTIGFQEEWFHDQFAAEGLPNCTGPFWGTCDADIAEWMGRRLEKRKTDPEFLYWVTLNSHLPVPVPAVLPAPASCSLTQSLALQLSLCSWYQLVANVHRSAADLAMGSLGRPTVFVIVGDHAPPFSDPVLRNRFSSTEVPFVILIPR